MSVKITKLSKDLTASFVPGAETILLDLYNNNGKIQLTEINDQTFRALGWLSQINFINVENIFDLQNNTLFDLKNTAREVTMTKLGKNTIKIDQLD